MPSRWLAGHHRRSQCPKRQPSQRVDRSGKHIDAAQVDRLRFIGWRLSTAAATARCPDSPSTRHSQSARARSVNVI